jgi:hypothetical protein
MKKSKKKTPQLIDFELIGSPNIGYLTVAEHPLNIPFPIKRTYWTYFTPNNVERGHHGHHELEQVIIAVCGIIKFELESVDGEKFSFVLNNPNVGLYIPKKYWRIINFSHNSVLLCLASIEYDEKDYIRDYVEFKKLK